MPPASRPRASSFCDCWTGSSAGRGQAVLRACAAPCRPGQLGPRQQQGPLRQAVGAQRRGRQFDGDVTARRRQQTRLHGRRGLALAESLQQFVGANPVLGVDQRGERPARPIRAATGRSPSGRRG